MVSSELYTKIGERVKTMCIIKAFLVFSMAALNLAVVAWRVGADELVADAQLAGGLFK